MFDLDPWEETQGPFWKLGASLRETLRPKSGKALEICFAVVEPSGQKELRHCMTQLSKFI